MSTITGIITEVHTARHTYNGNPIKAVTLQDAGPFDATRTFETLPNTQLGYMISNFTGKRVTLTLKDYRGTPRIKSVELV